MKNMKKLLQKAMVFTLAVAMLAGTPLTASAAGLSEIYKTEDGWGNVVGSNGPDDTNTGTVTVTQSYTSTLEEATGVLLGIELDEANLEIEDFQPVELKAELVWQGGKAPEGTTNQDLLKQLKWRSSNSRVAAVKGIFEDGARDKITVVPKAGGTAVITVSLDNDEKDIHYSASATVTVVTYAGKLKFNDTKVKNDAYKTNTLVLDNYVDRYLRKDDPETEKYVTTTSDVLTFSIKDTQKCTALKNGVLTLKKAGNIEVMAIGKNVDTGWYPIEIKDGNHASKIEFISGDGKKLGWKVNDAGTTYTVEAKVTKGGSDPDYCTDQLTWTSSKSAIVEIENPDPKFGKEKDKDTYDKATAKLVAKSAGKAVITVKASSGKSAKLTVTVTADVSDIVIEKIDTLYTGQSIDLYNMATQYFGKDKADHSNKNFIDAGLKWTFADTDSKKIAKLTTKGVLTINPDIVTKQNLPTQVKFKASAKNGVSDEAVVENIIQINLKSFTIQKGSTGDKQPVEVTGGKPNPKTWKTDEIAVDGTRLYKLTAVATKDNGDPVELENSGSLLGWTASNNGKIVKSTRGYGGDRYTIKALKKGTSKITITGAAKKANDKGYAAVKFTFSEKVLAPTKTLTLSVKNKGIAATGKEQTITITPKMDKGTTTNKNKNIEWTYQLGNESPKTFDKGKFKITLKDENVGQKIKVTAKTTDGNVKASIYLDVVKENPAKIAFSGADDSVKNNKIEVKAGDLANPGIATIGVATNEGKGGATVTYTVNNPNVAFVLQDPNDMYTVKVYGVTKGTAKLTAVTSDGKKSILTIKVNP